jgi:DNA polymerase IV (DinB-like DNA polymerase)
MMGITKVEELSNCDIQILSEKFGKMGFRMKQVINGLDFGEVREREEGLKSISRHDTFEKDTNDPVKIEGALEMLAGSMHNSLMKHRFLFKTIILTVRFEDFSTYTRSKTIPIWTSDIFVIKRKVIQLGISRKAKNKTCGVGLLN